jgi:hypothetical protein
MPAIANLTINDGQAAPAAHTFSVVGTTGAKATWADKSGGIPIGYAKFTNEVREAKSSNGAHSVIYGYELPTMGTVNGVSQRVRVSSAQVRLNYAQDSTDQERKDLVAYVINSLSNATVKAAAIGIEPHY